MRTLSLLLLLWCGGSTSDPLTVVTQHGPVTGFFHGGARAFLGIRYAQPPVGSLRFRKPRPPEPWTEPFNATAWPNACIGSTTQSAHTHVSTMSEDCLFLNVFTPKQVANDTLLPVLFWIHGGC